MFLIVAFQILLSISQMCANVQRRTLGEASCNYTTGEVESKNSGTMFDRYSLENLAFARLKSSQNAVNEDF
jgi:hypothetical protein